MESLGTATSYGLPVPAHMIMVIDAGGALLEWHLAGRN
jgi:hypothetical protein